jgi:hypothetical protein
MLASLQNIKSKIKLENNNNNKGVKYEKRY